MKARTRWRRLGGLKFSLARFTDAFNDDASKAGRSSRFGLNEYSELRRMVGTSKWSCLILLCRRSSGRLVVPIIRYIYSQFHLYKYIFVCLIDTYIDWRSPLFIM